MRDTTMEVAHGESPVRVLSFAFGTDTVIATLIKERVSQVDVSSPRFQTRDSVKVGTRLARLLRFPGVEAHFYAGRLYLSVPSHCGIVFELDATSVRMPETSLDSAGLARLSPTLAVDRMRAQGCPGVPLAQRDTNTTVRTDSVYLARDLDGNGTVDHVVQESRLHDAGGVRAYRLAVYLDSIPRRRNAAWATQWDEEFGSETSLGQVAPLGNDASVLVVVGGGGDYGSEKLLLVRRRTVREVASHGEDYGNGYFDVSTRGDRLMIDASLDHLEVPGMTLPHAAPCAAGWSAIRLTYDLSAQRFVAEPPRCVKRRDSPEAP